MNIHPTLVALLLDFLEVSFHQILYRREVYPEPLFCLRKKYNIPVFMVSEPQITSYIVQNLASTRKWIEEETVKKIVLSLLDEEEKEIERFTFEIQYETFTLETTETDKYIILLPTEKRIQELEHYFSLVIQRINTLSFKMMPLPVVYSSFEILVYRKPFNPEVC